MACKTKRSFLTKPLLHTLNLPSHAVNMQPFTFQKAETSHKEIIFSWLSESHMKAVWDNSPAHKQDIEVFMQGRKNPSSYLNGVLTYWVGSYEDVPISLVITAPITQDDTTPDVWKHHLCPSGSNYSIDFGIGNKDFLGKGLAAAMLEAFVSFFKEKVDQQVAQFLIEPHIQTAKIKRIHQKAGFHFVSIIRDKNENLYDQSETFLMIKRCVPSVLSKNVSLD